MIRYTVIIFHCLINMRIGTFSDNHVFVFFLTSHQRVYCYAAAGMPRRSPFTCLFTCLWICFGSFRCHNFEFTFYHKFQFLSGKNSPDYQSLQTAEWLRRIKWEHSAPHHWLVKTPFAWLEICTHTHIIIFCIWKSCMYHHFLKIKAYY